MMEGFTTFITQKRCVQCWELSDMNCKRCVYCNHIFLREATEAEKKAAEDKIEAMRERAKNFKG